MKKDHLREIFGYYGNVKDVELQAKSTANVVFSCEQDAEQAKFHMDGGQIDGLQVKVSFILIDKKKRRDEPSSSAATERPIRVVERMAEGKIGDRRRVDQARVERNPGSNGQAERRPRMERDRRGKLLERGNTSNVKQNHNQNSNTNSNRSRAAGSRDRNPPKVGGRQEVQRRSGRSESPDRKRNTSIVGRRYRIPND